MKKHKSKSKKRPQIDILRRQAGLSMTEMGAYLGYSEGQAYKLCDGTRKTRPTHVRDLRALIAGSPMHVQELAEVRAAIASQAKATKN